MIVYTLVQRNVLLMGIMTTQGLDNCTTTVIIVIDFTYLARSEEVAGDGATVYMEMFLMNQSEDDHFGGQEETRGSRLCCVM